MRGTRWMRVRPTRDATPSTASCRASSSSHGQLRQWRPRSRGPRTASCRCCFEGGGTKRSWGRVPERLDVNVGLRRLDRVLDHRQGDLTVSVEAGLTLRRLNEALALRGQQLPLDPPYADRATIGGLLATNDSGPARHRFGTPRDLVIGVQLATTDGRLAKAGGQVVKNVAGYDLSKLISGSFGTLAAIVSATFKVSPLPAASKTLVIEGAPRRRARASRGRHLEEPARAGGIRGSCPSRRGRARHEIRCLVRFASLPEVVDEQVKDAAALVGASGVSCRIVGEDAERRLWQAHSVSGDVSAGAAIVRASWLPANLAPRRWRCSTKWARQRGIAMIGRAAVGAGLIRIAGECHAAGRGDYPASAVGGCRQRRGHQRDDRAQGDGRCLGADATRVSCS